MAFSPFQNGQGYGQFQPNYGMNPYLGQMMGQQSPSPPPMYNSYGVGQIQQQLRQPVQSSGLPGKVINNPSEINPGDVPMNGSVSLFPTANYDTIYAKAWNQNGTIETVVYVPQKQDEPESPHPLPEEQFRNDIFARLDRFEKVLDERLTSFSSRLPQLGQDKGRAKSSQPQGKQLLPASKFVRQEQPGAATNYTKGEENNE